jgi:hypothetical protein
MFRRVTRHAAAVALVAPLAARQRADADIDTKILQEEYSAGRARAAGVFGPPGALPPLPKPATA